jgi:hypothetical protein
MSRRKSLAAVFSFSDKQKESESRHNSLDGSSISPTKRDKPFFGSISLGSVLKSTDKPNLISASPGLSISHALDMMKANKIFSLPLKSRSMPGNYWSLIL